MINASADELMENSYGKADGQCKHYMKARIDPGRDQAEK